MADKIKIDFKEIGNNLKRFFNNSIEYFKNLTVDMIAAWSAIGIGLIVLIIGIFIL